MNNEQYTISENETSVNTEDFRDMIKYLDKVVRVDFLGCVSDEEIERCVNRIENLGRKLINTTCNKATENDWNKRESIIDKATDILIKYNF